MGGARRRIAEGVGPVWPTAGNTGAAAALCTRQRRGLELPDRKVDPPETWSGRAAYSLRTASFHRSVGLEGEARWSRPRRSHLRPYWSVKTTRGVVSHFGVPAMHTGPPAYPAERQRLAARLLGRPWHTSGWGRGGSDPPVRGPGTGSGAGVFSHPCPRPLGVAPEPAIRAGRQFSAPLRGGGVPARPPPVRRTGGLRSASRTSVAPGHHPPEARSAASGNGPQMVTPNRSIGKRRSPFRDWAAEETDHLREVVEAALARSRNKIGAAYSRTDLFERRRLMDE